MAKVDRGGKRSTSFVITKPAVSTDLLHGQSFPRLCGQKSYRKKEIRYILNLFIRTIFYL